VGEQVVQEGTKHTHLRGHCVEDQHGSCVAYPYHLGAARQEVQDPVAEVLSLVMSFVGAMVLNAEQ
jgi:hypothetical protein